MPKRLELIPLLIIFGLACDQAPSGGLNGGGDQDTGTVEGTDAARNNGGADSGGAVVDSGGSGNADAGDRPRDSGGSIVDSGRVAPDARGGMLCDELAACCDRLPVRQRAQCRDAAAQGDEMACGRLLRMCPPPTADGGEPPPPGDGSVGPIPDSGSTQGPQCTTLRMCCARLQDRRQQRQCNRIVMRGQEGACRQAQPNFCGNGTGDGGIQPPTGDGGIIMPPTGDGGVAANGCARLMQCCPMLPQTVQPNCNRTVQTNIDATCVSFLTNAQTRGFCQGI